jgi:hypothetical protein
LLALGLSILSAGGQASNLDVFAESQEPTAGTYFLKPEA